MDEKLGVPAPTVRSLLPSIGTSLVYREVVTKALRKFKQIAKYFCTNAAVAKSEKFALDIFYNSGYNKQVVISRCVGIGRRDGLKIRWW